MSLSVLSARVRHDGGDDQVSHGSVREAALDAALDELQQWGVDRFSIEGAANRAQLTPDFFRQTWGSERQLIVDALLNYTREITEMPDTGSLHGDLSALTHCIARYLNDPVGRRIARMMVVDSKSYEVDVETRAQFWATRQQAVDEILRRAEARGELRDDVRPTVVMQLVSSPLHTLALYSDRPATHDYCQAIADLVARAVTRA